MIKKQDIVEPKLDWFKNELSDDFEIKRENQIIFGFNGIGKTTLFNLIKKKNDNDVEHLTYEGDSVLFDKSNKLILKVNVNEIINKTNENNSLLKTIGIKEKIKSLYSITKASDANNVNSDFKKAFEEKGLYDYEITPTELRTIKDLLGNIPPRLIFDLKEDLNDVSDLVEEIDKNINFKKFNLLKGALSIINDDTVICPVCENETFDLKSFVMQKITTLQGIKSNVIDVFEKNGLVLNDESFDKLNEAFSIINESEKKLSDYFACGGDVEMLERIQTTNASIRNNDQLINNLNSQAAICYSNILNVKTKLEEDMRRYFNVDSNDITFDNMRFEISIKFPRELISYSTGETNLINFLFKIYSFLGSQKNILLLDDPVSSLDIINHYKIAFEICKNADSTKNILVFTHSTELLNVINSQGSFANFKYYYLEKNGNRRLIKIKTQQDSNIITLNNLLNLNYNFSNSFIKSIIKKENDTENQDLQRIFHYYPQEYSSVNNEFSNHILCNLIDSFTNFDEGFFGTFDVRKTFYINSYIKILYLGAIRVWLEKKLFETITSDELKETYLQNDTLTKKIRLLLDDANNKANTTIPNTLNKEFLMSRKVMLNQAVHYHSQVLPFSYAINLSFDLLKEEILELKNIFN